MLMNGFFQKTIFSCNNKTSSERINLDLDKYQDISLLTKDIQDLEFKIIEIKNRFVSSPRHKGDYEKALLAFETKLTLLRELFNQMSTLS